MFFNLVGTKNEKEMKDFQKQLQEIYWPEKRYESYVSLLPSKTKISRASSHAEKSKLINIALEKITRNVQKKLYNNKHNMPFMDNYHRYFLQRYMSNQPIVNPRKQIGEIIRLSRSDKGNFSKNFGNFNHFNNVVLVTAQLINYFNHENRIREILDFYTNNEIPEKDEFIINVAYSDKPDMRTFRLLISAFYHDLGKTVVNHRHGMEGSIIIGSQSTVAQFQLDTIVKEYREDYQFEREDLLFLSDMLLYHDIFGTLATGEAGYTRLVEAIRNFKTYSLKELPSLSKMKVSCQRNIFDLWVLNLADIIASLGVEEKSAGKTVWKEKLEEQTVWTNNELSQKHIYSFLNRENPNKTQEDKTAGPYPSGSEKRLSSIDSKKSSILVHDLRIAINLLDSYTEQTHTDDTSNLMKLANERSRHHVVERIARLVSSCLCYSVDQQLSISSKEAIRQIWNIPFEYYSASVFNGINAVGDFQDFCSRAASVGSLDYALGFFSAIAKRALERVNEELEGSEPETGWIRSRASLEISTPEFESRANAQLIVDNYTNVVVKILHHLLFKNSVNSDLTNFEFKDASDRLTENKIERILGLEGPYRSSQSIQLIMQTIFMY